MPNGLVAAAAALAVLALSSCPVDATTRPVAGLPCLRQGVERAAYQPSAPLGCAQFLSTSKLGPTRRLQRA